MAEQLKRDTRYDTESVYLKNTDFLKGLNSFGFSPFLYVKSSKGGF